MSLFGYDYCDILSLKLEKYCLSVIWSKVYVRILFNANADMNSYAISNNYHGKLTDFRTFLLLTFICTSIMSKYKNNIK
jgi:hypothetical protein